MLVAGASVAQAATISCPDPIGDFERQFSLSDAMDPCFYGTGNATDDEIDGYYPGESWTEVGEETEDGQSGLLDISGSTWGQPPEDGDYWISDPFWSLYGEAVISIHVGNASTDPNNEFANEPDHFVFMIDPGTEHGTWSYLTNLGDGGGLSNFKLYGRGTPVPEPSTLLLLGTGLAMVGLRARRKKK